MIWTDAKCFDYFVIINEKHQNVLLVGLVWKNYSLGGFTDCGQHYLVIINGSMTTLKYQETLEYNLIPKLPIDKGKSYSFNKTIGLAILQSVLYLKDWFSSVTNWLIEFNGMSNHIGLFYTKSLGNYIISLVYLHFCVVLS